MNHTLRQLFIPLALTCFALSPAAQAVCQDGCFANNNTILGENALLNNTGFDNTAIGNQALGFNTTGTLNTAVGFDALLSNSSGYNNTAIGFTALASNTDGVFNTATGSQALGFNTSGSANTATGYSALYSNTTGTGNTAAGNAALFYNTTGSDNTAYGAAALELNTTGNNNTAVGQVALSGSTGSSNIALGFQAGSNLTTGSNNIDVGNPGRRGESATIRVGQSQTRTFIAGIRGVTTINANAIPVLIDSAGQLGTTSSSERYKHKIRPMADASAAILALKPISFCYKTDRTDTPQFGLIAEEVAKVDPDLVVRDTDGKPYTVRYDAVNAMLLNEFLKAHRKAQEQQATIAELRSTIAQQQKGMEALATELKEQSTQIQRVSAELAASRPAPQFVLNNP